MTIDGESRTDGLVRDGDNSWSLPLVVADGINGDTGDGTLFKMDDGDDDLQSPSVRGGSCPNSICCDRSILVVLRRECRWRRAGGLIEDRSARKM